MADQAPPRQLPSRPNLEHLKKQAKRKLVELRKRDAGASLSDAQLSIAREYDFKSWRALKKHVDEQMEGHDEAAAPLRTGVVAAVQEGDVEQLRILLDEHPGMIDIVGGHGGLPLLHLAATAGHLDIVALLLERGCDVHRRDVGDNAYALHHAAEQGHVYVVEHLIDAGADIQGEGTLHELSVLGWATCFASVSEEVADLLIGRGAELDIFSAVALNQVSDVRRMIGSDAGLLTKTMSRFEHHQTALHLAVRKNRAEMVNLLIELGADVTAEDTKGATPLAYASSATLPGIVGSLMERGATMGLREAVMVGRLDAAEEHLERDPARIRADGPDADLIVFAAEGGALEAVRWLIEHGADVDAAGVLWDVRTNALHQAAARGDREIVETLLDAGADPTLKDGTFKSTPIGWADYFGKPEIAELIRSRS